MASTNSGGKLYIAVDGSVDALPQNSDLNLAAYEALTWLEISNVGSFGETGTTVNILNYDTWDTTVTQKSAGIRDAGNPEIELAVSLTDAGQIELRTAATAANAVNNYAFKVLWPNNRRAYNRGIVTGPRTPNGRNEDFQIEMFTLGLNQEQIVSSS